MQKSGLWKYKSPVVLNQSPKLRFSKSFYSVKNKRNLSEFFWGDWANAMVFYPRYGLILSNIQRNWFANFFFENFDFHNLRLLILSLNSPVNWWNWHEANVRKLEHRKTHFFRKSLTFLRMVRTHDLFCFFLQIFLPKN